MEQITGDYPQVQNWVTGMQALSPLLAYVTHPAAIRLTVAATPVVQALAMVCATQATFG